MRRNHSSILQEPLHAPWFDPSGVTTVEKGKQKWMSSEQV